MRIAALPHGQYGNIVRDIFGPPADKDPAAGFQTGPTAGGNDNTAEQPQVRGHLGRDD